MDDVKVKRTELIERIRKNRDSHREIFLKAQDGYRARVIEELDKMLAEARVGKPVRVAVGLVAPQDHTNDYDSVLAMLEMSVDDVIELSQMNFRQYVLDQWTWKAFADVANTRYASGGTFYVGEDSSFR